MTTKLRVLVVDDEPDKRLLLAFALENEGYEVLTAVDGVAGLQAVELHQPDLIVTDVMMPRMDGYEMIRRVRANPLTKFIPVIIQSAARVEGRDVRLGSELGALGYITDPTDLDLLRARPDAARAEAVPRLVPGGRVHRPPDGPRQPPPLRAAVGARGGAHRALQPPLLPPARGHRQL